MFSGDSRRMTLPSSQSSCRSWAPLLGPCDGPHQDQTIQIWTRDFPRFMAYMVATNFSTSKFSRFLWSTRWVSEIWSTYVYIYNRFMDPCPWWQGLLSTSEFRLSQLSLHWPLGIWFRFSIWNPLTKLEEFSDLKNNAAMVGMIKHRKDNMIHSEVKKGGYAKILPRSNYLKLKNTRVSSTYKISTILLGFDPLRFTLWEISRSLRYVTHMSHRYELVDPIYLLRFIHQKSKYKSNS